MSRKTWASTIEEMNAKLEAQKRDYREQIWALEDKILDAHYQIKANKKDLEDIKNGK